MARRPRDFYETPTHYVNQILPLVDESDFVYEPCNGDGAISRFFPRVLTNDIDPARQANRHYDATTAEGWPVLSYPVDWVITNPPFKAAFEILQHAVHYAPNVAMLLRISFFEPTIAREPWLRTHAPDHLIYLPRYSFTQNGKSDNTTCVWGIWTERCLMIPPIQIARTVSRGVTMPCRDGREAPIDPDATTRFCCEALTALEALGQPIPDYIQQWWTDHKKWDQWRDSNFQGPMPEFVCRRW